MKQIEAVITPWTLDEFKEAAPKLGISEFNMVEVHRSIATAIKCQKRLYRGNEYIVDLLPRLKLEFVMFDDEVQSAVHQLIELVHPDSIAVFKLDQALHSANDQLPGSLSPSRALKGGIGAAISGNVGRVSGKSNKDSDRSSEIACGSLAAVKITQGA